MAMFPDAVTARGTKHLLELASLSRKGLDAAVLFIVHAPDVRYFMPEHHTDLVFSQTLLSVKDRVMAKAVSVGWNDDLTIGNDVRELTIPWDMVKRESHDSGSYIVILRLEQDRRISIGSISDIKFRKGFYLYVGSAKRTSPGGSTGTGAKERTSSGISII